jgi:S1-C subfamily serine protease
MQHDPQEALRQADNLASGADERGVELVKWYHPAASRVKQEENSGRMATRLVNKPMTTCSPWSRIFSTLACVILASCVFGLRLGAQVASNALLRVFEIRVGNVTGTTFTIEHNGRQYLITARHVIGTLPRQNAKVEIYKDGYWMPLTVNVLLPSNPEVDIAVLEISAPISPTLEFVPESKDVFFGQEVFFLGFPYDLHTLAGSQRIPFIKRGTVSAQDTSDPTASLWYIDGFNNPGFSGGPVVFQDLSDHKWKVMAVVQGYQNETAKVRVGKNEVNTNILVNSGILVAYDIRYALEAIDVTSKAK